MDKQLWTGTFSGNCVEGICGQAHSQSEGFGCFRQTIVDRHILRQLCGRNNCGQAHSQAIVWKAFVDRHILRVRGLAVSVGNPAESGESLTEFRAVQRHESRQGRRFLRLTLVAGQDFEPA